MALILDIDYKLVLRSRMRVLAKRLNARTASSGFVERDDKLLLERQLIKRIAKLNGFALPVRDEV